MTLEVTPEQVEFKELAIGDHCLHSNTFYRKTADRVAEIIVSFPETDLKERQFTGNALVNIVLNKE